MKKFISILLACALMLVPISAFADDLSIDQAAINNATSSTDQEVTPRSDHYTYKSEITGVDHNYTVGYGTEVTIGQNPMSYVDQVINANKAFSYTTSYSGNLNGVALSAVSASVGYSFGVTESMSNSVSYTVKAADIGKVLWSYAKPILTKSRVTIKKTTYVNGAVYATETSYVYTTRITGVSIRQVKK